MSLRSNIPDPYDMNEQRSLWAEVALQEAASKASGPQALADTRKLDNVAASFSCDLAYLADKRGWKLVNLLRVARARYDLEAEGVGEQFDGFEQLVPAYEPPEKPVQKALDRDAEDARADEILLQERARSAEARRAHEYIPTSVLRTYTSSERLWRTRFLS